MTCVTKTYETKLFSLTRFQLLGDIAEVYMIEKECVSVYVTVMQHA
jgi:hypothetical protein